MTLDNDNLALDYNSKTIISIPFRSIVNSQVNKNEIAIDLNQEEMKDNEDMLCEIRFFVPTNPNEKKELEEDDI